MEQRVRRGASEGLTDDETFSARYVGFVRPAFSGAYTFVANVPVATNQGLRLWIDNILVINEPSASAVSVSGVVTLPTANAYYEIQIDYTETTGAQGLELRWQSQYVLGETVPSSRLYYSVSDSAAYTRSLGDPYACASTSSVTGGGMTVGTVGVASTFSITIQ